MLVVTAVVVMFTQAQRKIPVQYAKRIIGRKMYGGHSTHIPLRVNTAGVIPIIFAQSIIIFPSTLASFFPNSEIMQMVQQLFAPGQPVYIILYGLMIIFFTYFYTAIVLNPVDLAENMKKDGGFVPGIRRGSTRPSTSTGSCCASRCRGRSSWRSIAVLPDMLMRYGERPVLLRRHEPAHRGRAWRWTRCSRSSRTC